MNSKNDELLLLLGWAKDVDSIGKWYGIWLNHAGERQQEPCRPYDNLQDGIDCVPEGREVIIYRAVMHWYREGGPGGEPPDKNKLPEALAEAIKQAVTNET